MFMSLLPQKYSIGLYFSDPQSNQDQIVNFSCHILLFSFNLEQTLWSFRTFLKSPGQ